MVALGKESKLSAAEVLQRAIRFFGPDGLGLEVQHWDAASVQLTGGGGHVVVRAQPLVANDKSAVEIEAREWEYDAERFLDEL